MRAVFRWCVIGGLTLVIGCDSEPMVDAGPPAVDAGADAGSDAGPPPPLECNTTGRSGGGCRMGSQCVDGLACYGSNIRADLTLGTFQIMEGTEDPANPGEYLPGALSTVPISVTPGGLCTEGCSTTAMADTCGECSYCDDDIGGPGSFGSVGIDIEVFDANMDIAAGENGVCRARCDFDPMSDGGCPMGYTCDLLANTCLERCVSDDQCNVEFGVSIAEGSVAIRAPGEPYTCNMTTGRCEHTAPPTAAFGAACARDADCEAVHGFCFAGHCATGHCAGADGMLASGTVTCPPDGSACLAFTGNNGSACLSLCDTADDCGADQACDPLNTPLADAMGRMWPGVCVRPCSGDTECQTNRVCDASIQRFNDATLGICAEFCDPGATGIMGAVTCAADEACVALTGDAMGRGVCRAQDNICAVHEVCFAGQACRSEGANLNGRCEAGCLDDTECNAAMNEECVRVDTDPDDGMPQMIGVCVAPGGACSPSPRRADGTALRLLRGVDGSAQCVSTQMCMAPLDAMGMPTPDAMGTCVDRP